MGLIASDGMCAQQVRMDVRYPAGLMLSDGLPHDDSLEERGFLRVGPARE